MAKRNLPLSKVYAALEAGPVVLAATAHKGRAGVMPPAWRTMLAFEPPLVGLVRSDRNYSCAALRAARECTLNVPTRASARTAVDCGNVSGATADKFAQFGLAPPLPAARVAECPLHFECRVGDVKAGVDSPAPKRLRTIPRLGGDRFLAAARPSD
ncbi:MAG: flavin reductase family protein [Kiritimatiellia bacterium]